MSFYSRKRKEWEEEISWTMLRDREFREDRDYLDAEYYSQFCEKRDLFLWELVQEEAEYNNFFDYLNSEEDFDYEDFPKHLEYEMDEHGYPIIESGKSYYEDDEINPLELAAEIRNIIFGDKEEEQNNLERMLNERHHLPGNKRISESYKNYTNS